MNKKDKKILYIGGGFDILHKDHKKFIIRGLNLFKEKYGNLEKVVIGLNSDIYLNKAKGSNRPFFSYIWRKADISNFLQALKIHHQIIKSSSFFLHFKNRNDVVALVRADYPSGIMQMKKAGIKTIPLQPINSIHTSTFEARLLEAQKKSNCHLRKVGALLIRQGKIINEGYSGFGDCDQCSKYLAYQKGGGVLSRTVKCDYPHAEVIALEKSERGDDLLITDSPCQNCAELIVSKKVRRVVYIRKYYDLKPILYLRRKGVHIRKSGL